MWRPFQIAWAAVCCPGGQTRGDAERHAILRYITNQALVAQLDRAPDFESGGRGFESLRARHYHRFWGRAMQEAEAMQGSKSVKHALRSGIGASVRRVEDRRFLTGQGRFVDDIAPPNMAFAYVVRSRHAHARIVSIDATAARTRRACWRCSQARMSSGRKSAACHARVFQACPRARITIVRCGRCWRRTSCATLAMALRWSLPKRCIKPRTPANCSR